MPHPDKIDIQCVIDHLPELFWVKNRQGVVLHANEAFAKAVGRLAGDVIGHISSDFWPAGRAEYSRADDEAVMRSGETRRYQETVSTSAGESWFETTKTPLRDIDGNIIGIVGTAREITAERREQERARLRQNVLELLNENAALEEILTLIVHCMERERPGVIASIVLLDADGRRVRSGAAPGLPDFYNQAIDGLEIGEGAGSCGTAMFRNERVVVADIMNHPYWVPYRELAAKAGVAACWSEPIRDSHGQVLGSFALYGVEPMSPGPRDIALIEDAAQIASVAIQRARSEQALQLASSVFESSSEAIVITGADNRILAVNPAFSRVTGFDAAEVIGVDPKILGSGRNDPAIYRNMWRALRDNGQWSGEILNRKKSGEEYVEWLTITTLKDPRGEVLRRIAMFSDITKHKQAEEKIWNQANFDHLTGLPNRRLFNDRLQQEVRYAQRKGGQLAVLFVDLDRFREINEAHGHDVGDILLIELAKRIGTCMRESDTLARFSGDKFMAVLPGITEPGVAERVAQSVLGALNEPFAVGHELAYVSGSIGIALYPDDATEIDELLKHVDQALNVAKTSGSNSYRWFRADMQAAAQMRRQLVRDLRGALADGQFEVYYQPIVEVASGKVVKAEALLRWHHPEHGMVSPVTFIPLAEEIGVIVEIGDWVFRTVARQVRAWCDGSRELQVSVNKSPRQFVAGNDHEVWIDFLLELGLPAKCVVIEITEGLLLDARTEVTEKLKQLRAAGIEIAIDDFGTGYSALSYLQKFDVDYLKIDKSFVDRLTESANARALADAMVAMSHKLGLRVIAEGVETEAQRDILAAFGCDYIQGYFYGRPMPAADFGKLLG